MSASNVWPPEWIAVNEYTETPDPSPRKVYTHSTDELDHMTTALHELYKAGNKAEGIANLRSAVGPAMTKHILELVKMKGVGVMSAIEITLKLYVFVQ